METLRLFEVRCPYERLAKKDGKLYPCNSLCVRVTPGSAGEARCRKCGLNFEFEVNSRAKLTTGVRVQPITKEEETQE